MNFKLLFAVMVMAGMGDGRSIPPQPLPEPAPAPTVTRPVVAELDMRQAMDAVPGDFLWHSRPLIVFADTDEDPNFLAQIEALRQNAATLLERDVVVIIDTKPKSNSEWRKLLHPRGFSLVIMDKDGQIKLRKPLPWSVREISRAIDKFPLRRQEINEGGRAQ